MVSEGADIIEALYFLLLLGEGPGMRELERLNPSPKPSPRGRGLKQNQRATQSSGRTKHSGLANTKDARSNRVAHVDVRRPGAR